MPSIATNFDTMPLAIGRGRYDKLHARPRCHRRGPPRSEPYAKQIALNVLSRAPNLNRLTLQLVQDPTQYTGATAIQVTESASFPNTGGSHAVLSCHSRFGGHPRIPARVGVRPARTRSRARRA